MAQEDRPEVSFNKPGRSKKGWVAPSFDVTPAVSAEAAVQGGGADLYATS